eukprot:scaffold6561_cov52-Cyclotella_meneghiniana.AAC.1
MSQPNYNHPSNPNQYSGATRNLIDAASKEIHSKTPNTISFALGSGVASSRRVTNPYAKTTSVRFTPNSEFATPAAALKQTKASEGTGYKAQARPQAARVNQVTNNASIVNRQQVTASAKNPHAANKTSAQAGGKLTSIIPRPRSIVSNPYAPRTSQAKVSKVNPAQVSDNGGGRSGAHCRYCHKEGHWKSECPENPDRQQKLVELPNLNVTHPPRKRHRRR